MEEIDKLDKATTFIYAILIFMNTFYIFGFLLFNANINLRFNTNMFFIVMPIVIFVVSIPGIVLGVYYLIDCIRKRKKTIMAIIDTCMVFIAFVLIIGTAILYFKVIVKKNGSGQLPFYFTVNKF